MADTTVPVDGLFFTPITTIAPTDEYCSIPTSILETFETVSFRNTHAIKWMHNIPPRYGKPKDVLLLMSGTQTEQQDYMRGLVASSITIFVFFVFWSTILLVFKCCISSSDKNRTSNNNRTRWLAGHPLHVDEPPNQKTKPYQYQEWEQHCTIIKRQLYCFRGLVLFAGLSIIISAIIMSIFGTNSLTQTLNSAQASINLVHGLATQAIEIVEKVIVLNDKVSSEIFTLLEDVNGMCPLIRDPLCDDLTNINTCDVSGVLGDDINDIFRVVVGHFAAGDRSVIYQEIIKAKSGLQDVQQIAMDANDTASHFNWALILSMVFSLLLAVLCLFIMSTLIFRMTEMLLCLKSRVMMPIFVILVIFSYVFSLLFVTASMATADLCVYETPTNNVDIRILTLLGRLQEQLSPIVVEFATFYIRQCPPQLLPQELVEQMEYVIAGVPAIQQFSAIVEESSDVIQSACGFQESETQKLLDLAETAQDQLCEVADILKRVRLFFQCENWFPLYETTTYEAICYDGTNGFAYIASTQFVIVFMAFIIVTFRVAFWDIQIGHDPDDDDDRIATDNDEGAPKNSDTERTVKEEDVYYKKISELLKATAAKDKAKEEKLPPKNMDRTSRQCWNEQVASAIGNTPAFNTTFSTVNTTSFSNDFEEYPHAFNNESRQYQGEPSTEENTEEEDGSGDLVLDEYNPPNTSRYSHNNNRRSYQVDSPVDDDESNEDMGVEVEHFANRADAWSIWARQFAWAGANVCNVQGFTNQFGNTDACNTISDEEEEPWGEI